MSMNLLEKQIDITKVLVLMIEDYRFILDRILNISQQGTHEETWSEVDAQAKALEEIARLAKLVLKGEPQDETLKLAHYPYSLTQPYPVAEFYTGDGSRLSSDSGESASGAGPAGHE